MRFWRPLAAMLARRRAVWTRLAQCEARLDDYDVALATIGIGRHRRGYLELVPDHAEAG